MPEAPRRLSTWESVLAVVQSWRLSAVTLLMFTSSLPLGLVWIAIPAWMARIGVDIKVIGIFTLAQAPWSFKFLWSPLIDRYPLPLLGRRRGWIFLAQILLFAFGLGLAGAARHPDAVWVIGALALATALASATYDIAYDAYTVDVVDKDEQGAIVAARGLLGRLAIWLSGGIAITVAAEVSWAVVNLVLALCYLPMLAVTWFAPEPEASKAEAPPTLREAVWGPFVGFLAQHRAIEILAFVVLYKLSDNLTQALLRPFFVKVGFDDFEVGIATMTVGTVAIIAGTAAGGLLTQSLGLGRALWIFGFLQIFSNLGYAVVAEVGINRWVLYAAQAFEMGTSGLGTGAFMVLLLRLTQKRFSATQYALLSSLMSLTRVFTGPPAGLLVDAVGWRDFFVLTVFAGAPGLWMLARFVPWSVKDPVFHVAPTESRQPISRTALGWASASWAIAAWVGGVASMALLAATKALRAGQPFDVLGAVGRILAPSSTAEVLTLASITVFGLVVGLAAAATLVARRGLAPGRAEGVNWMAEGTGGR